MKGPRSNRHGGMVEGANNDSPGSAGVEQVQVHYRV